MQVGVQSRPGQVLMIVRLNLVCRNEHTIDAHYLAFLYSQTHLPVTVKHHV